MKLSRKVATTSLVLEIFALDSSVATGAGKTGILFNAAGLKAYYKRNKGTASTAITLADITTLGTFASGGFKEVDATNMPGVYEFHPPDAALASGADSVVFIIFGATNMAPVLLEIELTAWDNQDGVRGALTALPNAAAAANGGLPTVNASNQVKVQGGVNKNVALAKFAFVMLDSVGNPATALTVNCKRSIDGAAFANCNTATATEISNGFYYVDLAAADLNGNVIALRFSATGARDTDITLIPSA